MQARADRYERVGAVALMGGEAFFDALNDLGAQGWELVGFASADKTIGLNALVAILRRPRRLLPPPPDTTEGWFADPAGRHPDRYWDGEAWTKWVRDKEGGTRSEDSPFADLSPR